MSCLGKLGVMNVKSKTVATKRVTPFSFDTQRQAPRPSLKGPNPGSPASPESVKKACPPFVNEIRLRLINFPLRV
jgi:hypothetical protein